MLQLIGELGFLVAVTIVVAAGLLSWAAGMLLISSNQLEKKDKVKAIVLIAFGVILLLISWFVFGALAGR